MQLILGVTDNGIYQVSSNWYTFDVCRGNGETMQKSSNLFLRQLRNEFNLWNVHEIIFTFSSKHLMNL